MEDSLYAKRYEFVLELGIKSSHWDKLKQDMQLDKLTTMELVEKCIADWKMRKSTSATLESLYRHFSNIELADAAEIVKNL